MALGFGKIVPPGVARSAEPITLPAVSPAPGAHIVPPEVVAASARARAILERAEAEAAALRARADADIAGLRAQAIEDARAHAVSRLAAETLALAQRDADADARALERSVELARLLAERLLDEELALKPSRVEAIARRALTEASGARRIRIVCHPEDAPFLQAALEAGRFSHVSEIRGDSARRRGNLRFETEIGSLDADIAPQLERLADRLHQALVHER
ncbi:MAG TPA: FliH/SctL family protein [Polyangiaceae bacterium]|nr:FliH/SctL family protein [Polyangiaceae bacterium]